MREQFTTFNEWLYVTVIEGGCGIERRGQGYWAQGWEGRCFGEWDEEQQQGWVDFG